MKLSNLEKVIELSKELDRLRGFATDFVTESADGTNKTNKYFMFSTLNGLQCADIEITRDDYINILSTEIDNLEQDLRNLGVDPDE